MPTHNRRKVFRWPSEYESSSATGTPFFFRLCQKVVFMIVFIPSG
ncbi:hypothetical protein BACUNI_00090 [Bacteroides uniformis ATCC 8492]|uniref:Uncharacterized protein n=1 Tax=Bacteroides uniformis (strain ATCC 8492 / DSM 6597 / CCUG 4942 / CIP 103695 / JCM 5828 / KCTC 5204 / NCTC 13054 / VPI 0061) TaxID=411479 RepID=A0ABC9NI76_BACUC|nr:hypothetical protein BACUNI_00090 [Bacteroides uniformis ATCC 8492]